MYTKIPFLGSGGGVSFLIGLTTGVRMYNMSGLPDFEKVMSTRAWAYTVDFHYSKQLVFCNTKGSNNNNRLEV